MATLFDSEAGLMLIAEELKLLAYPTAIKILLQMATGPQRPGDLLKAGKLEVILKHRRALEENGTILPVRMLYLKRTLPGRIKKRNKPRYYLYYFPVDDSIVSAILEAAEFVVRRHEKLLAEFEYLFSTIERESQVQWGKPEPRWRRWTLRRKGSKIRPS